VEAMQQRGLGRPPSESDCGDLREVATLLGQRNSNSRSPKLLHQSKKKNLIKAYAYNRAADFQHLQKLELETERQSPFSTPVPSRSLTSLQKWN